MSWPATLGVALLNALFGAVLAGFVASLSVDWYRISAFEGQSGYMIVFSGLGGLLGGFVLGIVVARIVAAGANPGFAKGLGGALLATTLILGAIGGLNRWLADVPPSWDGRTLMLHVELRWPASQRSAPATAAAAHRLELAAMSGDSVRLSRPGPLWLQDARLEDGRWIAPGVVDLYTNRGRRLLRIEPELPGAPGLLLPLKGTPGREHAAWSEWMPRARPGAAPLPDGFSYRFRVAPRSEPIRTERIGGFEIDTIAETFHLDSAPDERPGVVADHASFRLRHRGKLVAVADGPPAVVSAVATLPGEPPALLVLIGEASGPTSCRLLTDDAGTLRALHVASCAPPMKAEALTDDETWRLQAARAMPVRGQIDRRTYMRPGLYLFGDAILDTGRRSVRAVKIAAHPHSFNVGVPPLGLSPDGRGIVRLGFAAAGQDAPALLVQDTEGAAPYLVDIDTRATRYGGPDNIGPVWLAHYFAWQRDGDGPGTRERLAPRPAVKPLPWRGSLHADSDGSLSYHLQPAGVPMSAALGEALRGEPGASVLPPHDGELPGTHKLRIGEATVNVFVDDTNHRVVLYLDPTGDEATRSALVNRLAARFDALLATGRHDALFEF